MDNHLTHGNHLTYTVARFVLLVVEVAMVAAAVALAIVVAIGVLETQWVVDLPEPGDDVLMELPDDNLAPLPVPPDLPASPLADSGASTEAPALPRPLLKASPQPTVARGHLLGRIEAPSVRLVARVLEGTDARTLFRGAGHIQHTAFPGQPGNVGIAGHRDTVFRPLRRLKVGETITVTTARRVLRYKVARTWVVNPKDVQVLQPTAHPALTLVTCYPFSYIGPAPQRYIVRADLIGVTERRVKS